MKLSIGTNNFTDIGTAVFYTQEDIDNQTYSKVQHRSNSSLLYDGDFSEYDFSYEVEKDKFNDEFLVDYLGDKTLSLFDLSSDALEKLESIIFPTLGDQDWEGDEDKYFGTTIINNQVFALFHAEAGVCRIELYNGLVYGNNANTSSSASAFVSTDYQTGKGNTPKEEPYFVITLGEPGNDEVVESTDLVRQKELEDEVEYEKMVWLLITSNNEVSEVNLSYKSWVDSINPNRNMNQYLLRNDEFWSTKDSVRISEIVDDTDEGLVLDANSGTLLGTEKLDLTRLLAFQKIKERVNNSKYSSSGQGYPNYFPYNTYKKGDIVYYGGDLWRSVADNNFNHNPALSIKWIKSSVIESTGSIRIIVKVIPEEGGYCEPMGYISISSLNELMLFRIYPSAGYELNTLQPCLLSDEEVVVLTDDDYNYNVPENAILVTEWSNIVSTGMLVFNMKSVGSNVVFSAEYDGDTYSYSKWSALINSVKTFIYKVVERDDSGTEYSISSPYIDDSGQMKVTTGKEIDIYFREILSYSIDQVQVSYEDSSGNTITTYVTPVELEDGGCMITLSSVNFTSASLKLILTQKYVTLSLIEFSGFEVSNYSIKTVSGNTVTFKFIDNEYDTTSGNTVLADNLDRVILTDSQGNTLEILRYTTQNVAMSFGGYTSVYFSRVDSPIGSTSYGEYTVKIDSLYYDTTVQILRK